MNAPVPDLKPRVAPAGPGSEDCGCCAGIAAATPQGIANRAGLSALAYRIGDYDRFRASMHAALSSSRFAALAPLRTRDNDDFSIGLIDALACSADVLTFYQERIANESYLRTARERVSLQEMGKLIGYRLRPGVAAETWLAFALETPPPPPPGLPAEPGNFVTGVPASLALDAGLKVQSVPGPGEQPQVFETLEPLADARAAWNGMRPWMTDRLKPGLNDTTTYLQGVRNNLRPGDAVVFLGDEFLANTDSDNWDFRIIDSVVPQNDEGRTLIGWKRPLGALAPFSSPAQDPQVHVLRKRVAAFGHNAPMWGSMSYQFRRNYPDAYDPNTKTLSNEWPHFELSPVAGGYVDLDTLVPEAGNGSYVALAKGEFNYPAAPAASGTHVELYKVASVAEVSRAAFALSGKVSRLRLSGENFDTQFRGYVRETSVFAASEQLQLAEYPVDGPVGGSLVPVAVAADGLLPGRRLLVRGNRAKDGVAVTQQALLVAAHPAGSGRCFLELALPLAAPLARNSVVVYGNVVPASHGESVAEVLGAGAATPFQRFQLKQMPLTWRGADNELGAAPALTVRVNDVAWRVLPTLFGTGALDHACALVTDEQGRNFVTFGDGVRGARLPSGTNNVRAQYRKGLGAAGNVGADKLTQLMTRPLGLKSVSNLLPAAGGSDPEPAAAARRSMPLATRTLGRAVSLLDYEDFARAFTGIAKASAQVLQLPSGPVVALTIAADNGAAIGPDSPTWQRLLAALRNGGDPHVQVRLLAATISTFRLGIRVKRDPDYEKAAVLAALEAALRAGFAFDARALSQPVQQSEVLAAAQAVPGVVAVDLTRLYGGTQPYPQTQVSVQVRLLAARMQVLGGAPQPAELLTLDPAPFDLLEEMT